MDIYKTTCTFVKLLLAAALILPSQIALATERILTTPFIDGDLKRQEYSYRLLQTALLASENEFGPFELGITKLYMENRRLISELVRGEKVSIGVSMHHAESAEKVDFIPFPIMKGLASYRLFFTLREHQTNLKSVRTIADLKTFKIGQGYGWSTVKILNDNGFKTVVSGSSHRLFKMLNANRFQLFMRSVFEIPHELDKYADVAPTAEIANGLMVYTYLPMYFVATKKQPQLKDRVHQGLIKAFNSGEADKLFFHYYQPSIDLLNSEKRKIFFLKNTNLPEGTYERNKPYILQVDRNGVIKDLPK